jgi:hypothetical protein
MEDWKDYYQILGVNPGADDKEIKRVYRYKVSILHPDRLMGFPEHIRRQAEEDLKALNQAYETLKDPQKRAQYDSEWLKERSKQKEAVLPKPSPVVNPSSILFKNLKPGETQTASFIVQNQGGPYARIWISNPDSWVKLIDWGSVNGRDELPLRVEIEVKGDDWGKTYLEHIVVKLDEKEVQVKVRLQMKDRPMPRPSPQSPPPSPPPPPPPPSQPSVPITYVSDASMPTILKWLLGICGIVVLIWGLDSVFTYYQSKSHQFQGQTRFQSQTTVQPTQSIKPVESAPGYTLLKTRHYQDEPKEIDSRIETSLGKWITEKFGLKMRWISFREHRWLLSDGYLNIEDYTIIGENVWAVGSGSMGVGYIFYSSDNGISWELQRNEYDRRYGSGTYPFVIYFLSRTEGWVGSKDGLFCTKDGGRNWQFSADPREEIMYGLGDYKSEYWFYNNYRIVAKIAWGNKHESLDGGKSWRVL